MDTIKTLDKIVEETNLVKICSGISEIKEEKKKILSDLKILEQLEDLIKEEQERIFTIRRYYNAKYDLLSIQLDKLEFKNKE